jgi:hypothetical protein
MWTEDPLRSRLLRLPPLLSHDTDQPLQTTESGFTRVTLTQHERTSEHRERYQIPKTSDWKSYCAHEERQPDIRTPSMTTMETPHEDLTVSWDEIHKSSVMVDLNIVPSDDEDDEDYTESTGDTKVTEPKYGHFIDVPNINIHLGLPTGARTATLIFPTSPSPLSKQWCKSSTGII